MNPALIRNARMRRASVAFADENDQRSVTESRGRHRPEEPDTTARGHSDRSRREGCGTEKVLGGSRNSGSGTLLVTAAFQRNPGEGQEQVTPRTKNNLTSKERRRDQRAA
jgi:hypothetical protein